MKKVKYLLFFAICCFACPMLSNAECSYERQAELSRIASNVQLGYTYEMKEKMLFYVYIANVSPDIYVIDNYGNKITNDVDNLESVGGMTHSFAIYSNDSDCYGQKLLEKYVTLPFFNSYSLDKRCETAKGFKYCNLWLDDRNISADKFDEEYQKYIDNSEKNITVDSQSIFEFNYKYIYVLIGVVLVVALTFIYRRRKRGSVWGK